MNEKTVKKIISEQPKKAITLDNIFKENDKLKANTVLQIRDVVVDFKPFKYDNL